MSISACSLGEATAVLGDRTSTVEFIENLNLGSELGIYEFKNLKKEDSLDFIVYTYKNGEEELAFAIEGMNFSKNDKLAIFINGKNLSFIKYDSKSLETENGY